MFNISKYRYHPSCSSYDKFTYIIVATIILNLALFSYFTTDRFQYQLDPHLEPELENGLRDLSYLSATISTTFTSGGKTRISEIAGMWQGLQSQRNRHPNTPNIEILPDCQVTPALRCDRQESLEYHDIQTRRKFICSGPHPLRCTSALLGVTNIKLMGPTPPEPDRKAISHLHVPREELCSDV